MYPKKNISILFTLYFAASSLFAQQNNNQPAAFSQNIIYSAPIVHDRIEDVRKEWWYSRLEAITHYRFMSPLLNRVIKKELPVYSPFDPFRQPIMSHQIDSLLITTYDVNYEYLEMGMPTLIRTPDTLKSWEITALSFNEEWKFDAEKKTFEKIVKGIIPQHIKKSDNGDYMGLRSLFYIPVNQPKNDIEKNNLPLLSDRISYDVRIKNTDVVEDSVSNYDIATLNGERMEISHGNTEISVLDEYGNIVTKNVDAIVGKVKYITDKNGYETRVEGNKIDTTQFPRGLSQSQLKMIAATLYEPVMSGKMIAYFPEYPYKKPLSKNDLQNILSRADTVMRENLWYPGLVDTFISKKKLSSDDITSLRFFEEWRYDPAKLIFCKKVKGVMLLRDIAGKSNSEWGSKPLFYLPLNGSEKEIVSKKSGVTTIEYITYNATLDPVTPDWMLNPLAVGIDSIRYVRSIDTVIRKISSGAFPAGDAGPYIFGDIPETRFFTQLAPSEVYTILHPQIGVMDSVGQLLWDSLGKQITKNGEQIPPAQMRGLFFNEEWQFDLDNLHFTKTVKGICPQIKMYADNGEFRWWKSLLYVPLEPDMRQFVAAMGNTSSQTPAINYTEIARPENLLGKNVLSYATINLGDYNSDIPSVPAEPSCAYNLEYSKREAIVKTLIDGVRSGKITAYTPTFQNGNETQKMSVADFNKAMIKKIQWGENLKTAPVEYYDIDAFRFNESWYFDKTKMVFYKKVNGLYLVKRESKNSEQGWMYDYRPLVYIPLK